MRRREADHLPFNVVAICEPGESLRAIRNLEPVGRFRATPYRGVLVGVVAGDPAVAVREAWDGDRSVFGHVVRLIPLERVVVFERDDVTEQLCRELEGSGPRVAGQSFHVRARLRGLSGKVESQAVERALGGLLLDVAAKQQCPARVSFKDPDLVLAVEVIGRRVGFGFLDRDARAVPLVRVR